MVSGRCHYCKHGTVAIAGPANHKPRIATHSLRVGYLIEAAEGQLLDKPLLVCGRCLFFALPSNIAA